MRIILMVAVTALIIYVANIIVIKKRQGTGNYSFAANSAEDIINNKKLLRLKNIAASTKNYVLQHNYNSSICFFIDMQLPPGSKRFFVYDIINDTVLLKGLVTHGGGKNNSDTIEYANTPGSNCTSQGKYKIGKPYYGKFGLAYKLFGLDKTNSNAFKRYVVLHSHACVPDREVAPATICCSQGCPTVSPAFLNQLKPYLDRPGKPILLNILN